MLYHVCAAVSSIGTCVSQLDLLFGPVASLTTLSHHPASRPARCAALPCFHVQGNCHLCFLRSEQGHGQVPTSREMHRFICTESDHKKPSNFETICSLAQIPGDQITFDFCAILRTTACGSFPVVSTIYSLFRIDYCLPPSFHSIGRIG